MQHLFILIKLKRLLDLIRLFDKVTYFRLQLLMNLILLTHFMKIFKFFLLLLIVSLHLAYNRPHVIDVVCQSDTAEGFYEDEYQCLVMIGSRYVTKTYSKHDIGSPIIPPNIFIDPLLIFYSNFVVPILFWVDAGHKVQ